MTLEELLEEKRKTMGSLDVMKEDLKKIIKLRAEASREKD